MMDVLPAGANASAPSWTLDEVSLSYDTANEDMFPGAYNRQYWFLLFCVCVFVFVLVMVKLLYLFPS